MNGTARGSVAYPTPSSRLVELSTVIPRSRRAARARSRLETLPLATPSETMTGRNPSFRAPTAVRVTQASAKTPVMTTVRTPWARKNGANFGFEKASPSVFENSAATASRTNRGSNSAPTLPRREAKFRNMLLRSQGEYSLRTSTDTHPCLGASAKRRFTVLIKEFTCGAATGSLPCPSRKSRCISSVRSAVRLDLDEFGSAVIAGVTVPAASARFVPRNASAANPAIILRRANFIKSKPAKFP